MGKFQIDNILNAILIGVISWTGYGVYTATIRLERIEAAQTYIQASLVKMPEGLANRLENLEAEMSRMRARQDSMGRKLYGIPNPDPVEEEQGRRR